MVYQNGGAEISRTMTLQQNETVEFEICRSHKKPNHMGGMGDPKAHFVPPMTSRWKLLKGKLVPINIIGVKVLGDDRSRIMFWLELAPRLMKIRYELPVSEQELMVTGDGDVSVGTIIKRKTLELFDEKNTFFNSLFKIRYIRNGCNTFSALQTFYDNKSNFSYPLIKIIRTYLNQKYEENVNLFMDTTQKENDSKYHFVAPLYKALFKENSCIKKEWGESAVGKTKLKIQELEDQIDASYKMKQTKICYS
ncbi:hypothetical protein EDC94DRAFT_649780 [Helicostylum pulchrum]|nr:hypothetical protein EDC94DRAFT_649780 [Helicostylum pulchrum]